MEQDKDFLIAALTESNDLLQEDNARLRNTARVLRSVNSALRGQLKNAHANDEEFRNYEHGEMNGYIAVEVDYLDIDQPELGSRT